jgi:hypothetical protein
MVISDRQREANRQNAQHSTGPKTPEGKAAIRFNALSYGLRTRATILPDENAAEYSKLWDELEADWQPQNRTEYFYLETMVTSQWLLARAAASEQKIYRRIRFGERQFKMLADVAKQRAQLERSFRSAVEDMKKSQKERAHQPARQPRPAPTAQPAKPAYVMSEGAEPCPLSCSPVTPDTR